MKTKILSTVLSIALALSFAPAALANIPEPPQDDDAYYSSMFDFVALDGSMPSPINLCRDWWWWMEFDTNARYFKLKNQMYNGTQATLDSHIKFKKVATLNGVELDGILHISNPGSYPYSISEYPESRVIIKQFWKGIEIYGLSSLDVSYRFVVSGTSENLSEDEQVQINQAVQYMKGTWITFGELQSGVQLQSKSSSNNEFRLANPTNIQSIGQNKWKAISSDFDLTVNSETYKKSAVALRMNESEAAFKFIPYNGHGRYRVNFTLLRYRQPQNPSNFCTVTN